MNEAIYNLRTLDEAADKRSVIHELHPAAKIAAVFIYVATVVSCGKFEIADLLTLAIFPVIIFLLADIPVKPLLTRLLAASPIVLFIGVFNPVFDKTPYNIFGLIVIGRGWISFLSLAIKYILTVSSALLLVSTTGMMRIAGGLETLRIPKVITVQLLLVYRYIYILLEEVLTLIRAYAQRSGYSKGVSVKTGGMLLGSLFIRTYDKAQRIYLAMCQRGFTGRINMGKISRFNIRDVLFTVLWPAFFIAVKYMDLPALLGSLFI